LTSIGQSDSSAEEKEEMRKDYWVESLRERKLGYTDLVRSLIKIVEDAPEAVDDAVSMLTDIKLIKNSLVMPFQLYIAAKMVSSNKIFLTSAGRKVFIALEKAVEISCGNVPEFGGKTLVVVDRSASMNSPTSNGKTDVLRMSEVGTLMGLFLARKNSTDLMIFGNTATYVPYNPLNSIVSSLQTLMSYNGSSFSKFSVGHGTNFGSIFSQIREAYDRIIILSDMQCNFGLLKYDIKNYSKKFGANPKIYLWDLRGHGSLQLPEEDTYVLSGFSEKVFDIMKLLEQDKEALVKEIEKVVL
jgi:hypothetical protein